MSTHNEMMKKWMKNAKFKKAYNKLADEFSIYDEMLLARKKAGLTQEEVASKMGTKKSAVARLEASGGTHKHSPSINTLRKYAAAVGCHLEIKLKHCSKTH
jgi:DNA-binding XRE family transcriptional regulator